MHKKEFMNNMVNQPTHNSSVDLCIPSPKFYFCNQCKFHCKRQSEWNRHLERNKHKLRANIIQEVPVVHKCDICSKIYNVKSSLVYHKRSCSEKKMNDKIEKKKNANVSMKKLVMDLMKENTDLNQRVIELSNEPRITNINNTTNNNTYTNNTYTNTNNTNNAHFNLNVFLNETCKDALNIDDFMDSIKLTAEDLEQTGKLGFVQGITRIFLKGLENLDVTQRPFHCTDVKRETMYIKDQDVWEKETNEKKKMKQALNQAVRKNLGILPLWQKDHPDFLRSNTKDNDEYIKISLNSLGSQYDDEQSRMDDKIIRNVLRQTILDKNGVGEP